MTLSQKQTESRPGFPLRQPENDSAAPAQDVADLYRHYRSYAFAVAYRMLGSAADAEDVVQELFAELSHKLPAALRNPKSYVARAAANRCLNLLNSARGRRERYIGDWLPEPVDETALGPEEAAVRGDTLSFAFLVMLDKLNPTERIVFVLREAFDYPYGEIAEMTEKSESAVRQIFSRTRRKLRSEGPPSITAESNGADFDKADAAEEAGRSDRGIGTSEVDGAYRTDKADKTDGTRAALLQAFAAAFAAYDVPGVLRLLGERPMLVADGGGERIRTIVRPMEGRKGVCALLTSRRLLRQAREWTPQIESVNGELQLVYREEGEARMILMPYTESGGPDGMRIDRIYMVIGPEKLGSIRSRSGE
ncbi:sigma-70 family RNA polymerase sigma factor [Saccharibacillus sp. CPCC 101409]|uniref:sigma-70 family RNA polymerase sigma factor n=1 Tax=Saccharibacillus sp. CPCC 101409 TaxID=3058041 RepID=UPI00267374AB|nr:sigma-70 family RNA polymerase sigma factor [Saccharibacillus sp. CPCC 101409]MDO3413268.1 sigma-70 family RNA polymerase sigma factor [Saccharibacillus sp. CPCC 101409]